MTKTIRPIRLSLELSLQSEQEVSDLIAVLTPFAGGKSIQKDAPEPSSPKKEAPKKEAPKKEAPKKEAPKKEAPKKEAPKKEAPKKEAPKKEAPKKEEQENAAKIEDVRSILAKKVADNRAEIKAKLTELDAKNVTNLDKSKYPEFIEFLKGL